jgi:hypothetical protein
MKTWTVILALPLVASLLPAQNPSIQITNVPAGLTVVATSPGGIAQFNVPTFRFYVDGADLTAAFLSVAQSGHPLVTVGSTATTVSVSIAADLTAFHFAARVCTFAGLCGAQNVSFEGFDGTVQRDPSFVQTFGPAQARWADVSAPSQLTGRALSGSPAGPLGTRFQAVVDPQPTTTIPQGLFSPFDASAANSAGQCGPNGCNLGPAINPNGGSHIMHLYEAADLSNVEDSLEQIEWSSSTGVVAASTYPQYRIWCGVTSTAAPLSGGVAQGMTSVFDANYNLLPYQAGVPIGVMCSTPTLPNARKVPCGGPASYTTALQTTQFYPFPLLNPCFDFSTSTGASGAGVNLLIEQNIEPGMQVPNFNRYRATNFTPVRRLLDKPLSLTPPGICPFNLGGTFDIYKMRFTFVGLVAQARSLWYDTGTANPTYQGFILMPPVNAQPAGTQSTWILEGTDTSNPTPGTVGSSGVYVNAAGVTNPFVLSFTIAQFRYFRFRVELRGNNLTNTSPAYADASMVWF